MRRKPTPEEPKPTNKPINPETTKVIAFEAQSKIVAVTESKPKFRRKAVAAKMAEMKSEDARQAKRKVVKATAERRKKTKGKTGR